MTKEEAARALAIWKDKFYFMECAELVIDLAIKALEQPEPCEDAVSRFKVLRLIEDSSNDLSDSVDNRYMQNKVKKLPPVTPKLRMGKWLINSDGYYPYCSECKTEPKSGEMTDFCPKCGAKMEG